MSRAAHLTHMSAMVLAAAAAMLTPAHHAKAGLLTSLAGGAGARHGMEALSMRKQAKQKGARADQAAGRVPAPSAMGKDFDDTFKARLAKVKAEQEAAKGAQREGAAPGFKETFKRRLAASKARAAHEAGQQASAARGPKGP